MNSKRRLDMNFTELEKIVYNLLIEEMGNSNGILDTQEIAEALNLRNATVKGVLGSLTKKGKVDCDQGEGGVPPVVWPVHVSGEIGFLGDIMTKEEILSSLIPE